MRCFSRFGTICTIKKKMKKYPWRSVTFKTCNFAESNTPPLVFFTFLNFTNGTKSCNAPQIVFEPMSDERFPFSMLSGTRQQLQQNSRKRSK